MLDIEQSGQGIYNIIPNRRKQKKVSNRGNTHNDEKRKQWIILANNELPQLRNYLPFVRNSRKTLQTI